MLVWTDELMMTIEYDDGISLSPMNLSLSKNWQPVFGWDNLNDNSWNEFHSK